MSFYEKLKELFPNHEEAALDDVIGLVDEELPHGAEDVKFERMCILLMENFSNQDIVMSGTHSDEDENAEYDEAQHKQNRISTIREQVIKKFPNIQFSFLDKLLNEGSVPLDYMDIVKYLSTKGYPKTDIESDALVDHEVVNIIIQVFPDACPEYIGKCMQNGECCNDVIEKFLDEGYVKKKKLRNKKTKEIHQRFVEMLPNFDPDFLYSEAARLENTTEPNIIRCLNTLMEMKDYPTVKEYDERMGKRRELLDYLFEFKIDAFLKEFSNSVSNFESATEHSLEYNDNEVELEKDRKFAEAVLCHVYKQDGCKPARVKATFEKCDYDILACCRILGFLKRPCINENALVLPDNSYKNKRMFQEVINKLIWA